MIRANGAASGAAPRLSAPQLIRWLNDGIDAALRPLVADARLALLDFPSNPNVGDSAIWLGTLAYLRSAGCGRLCYTSDSFTYSREHLAARIGDGTILLSGGGNLGDLWPAHQQFREAVITDFPRNHIVQLPQTVHFQDAATLARARAVFDRHPNLTLLLRDRQSLDIARQEFRAPSLLCPDMALCLGTLRRRAEATRPIICLARSDHESAGQIKSDGAVDLDPSDWLKENVALRALTRLSRVLPVGSPALRWLRTPLSGTYAPVAARRVRRGCELLGAGRLVITDRLHGHVLCLLLGIPHLLLDTRYGKIRSFYETWTYRGDLTRWCDTAEEALAIGVSEKSF